MSIGGMLQRVLRGSAKTKRALPEGLSRDLSSILRPQAAYRWLLPQLAAITPQYIEMVLRGAMAGNHVQAWELFDLMEDSSPRLAKNLNDLKTAVCDLDWKLWPCAAEDSEPTPEAQARADLVAAAMRLMAPNPVADENGFRGTVYDLMDAWGKGQTALEVDWQIADDETLGQILAPRATYWVHPTCYCWTMEGILGLRMELRPGSKVQGPKSKVQSPKIGDRNGYTLSPGVWQNTTMQPLPSQVAEFPDDKFLIGLHKAKSGTALAGALLRPLAWWWLAGNFSADFLLRLAEVFGLPFRWANFDPQAPQPLIDSVCRMLENMGSSGWAAFPAGTTLELKEASKSGESTPQADLLDRAEKQMDLLILGQTLTTDVGAGGSGSRALGEVHERVRGDVILGGGNFVAEALNTQLIPSILRLNFGDTRFAPTYRPVPKEEKDAKAYADRDAVLMDRGVAMPRKWFYKRHDIPEPQDGEDMVGGKPESPKTEDRNPKETRNPKPEQGPDREPVKAKSAAASSPSISADGVLRALASDLAPVRSRLEAILAIEDPEVLQRRLESFLVELDKLGDDIGRDPETAHELAKVIATGLAQGLSAGAKSEGRNPKSDSGALSGGEFHGNQYVTVADEHWTGTPKEMHKRASAILKGFNSVQHPELGEIKFTRDGRDKTLYDKRTPHEFQSVKALPDLISKARLVSSEPDREGHPNVKAFHKLEHGLQIGDTKYRAEITVKETEQGGKSAHKFYLHRLKKE